MRNLTRLTLGAFVSTVVWQGTLAQDQADDPQNQDLEEVVVTGSYLKRTAADSPSPLSVTTAADIEDLGVADVAEIVQTLPWQSGSQTRATTFGGEGADGRNTINLRNLGHGATLPLVNGKRNVASWFNARGNASVNINALIPTIAIERMEIVKDGASALYGSDAIAGVVNFITKKDFEGLDFSYQFSTDEETGAGDAHHAQMIWGVKGDRGGIVFAASYLDRSPLTIGDRYDRFGGSSVSSTGQPGRIQPVAGQTVIGAAHSATPGQPASFGRQADLDCENSAALEEGGPIGTVFGGVICGYDFGSFFALQAEEKLRQLMATGHFDITSGVELYFEAASNDSEFDRDNSLNPNALNLTIPTHHLGNREDAFRRGIEPIEVINRTRLIGGTINTPDALRPIRTFTDSNRSDERFVVGALWDLKLLDRDWTIDASFTASEHDTATSQVQDTLSTEMLLAINGLGGPNCDHINGTPGEGNLAYAASGGDFNAGNCYYFNPFGNSAFNRTGGSQTDLTLVNPRELYEWLLGRITNDAEYRQRVFDVVAAGDINDNVGLAVGFQRRKDSGRNIFDAAANTGNLDFVFGAKDWQGELTTTAVFAEVGFRLLDNTLEINVAGRYEDFDELGENTFDPKISILWRPIDELSLRASAGSSFRVPSLIQLFGSLTTVANQTDFGGDAAFRPSITEGNINLKPESADNYNLGLSWAPTDGVLEGLQIDLDYYDYDYTDIITREATAVLLSEDNEALRAYIAANPGETLISAVNAGIGNRRQIVRNGQGLFLRALPDFINANSANVSGIDLNSSYSFDSGFGSWRLGLQLAYVLEYEVEVPNSSGGSTTIDAVGEVNEFNPVARPLPEYRLNATLNWSMDKHRAFLIVQHTPSVDYGIDLATDPRGGSARFWRETVRLVRGDDAAAEFFTRDIDSFTTIDVQYSYNLGAIGPLADSTFTLGIKNIANEEPPFAPVNTGFLPTLHDPRGRVWMARINASF